ncbi:MAG: DUF4118 domain-containing protein [Clostridia bacterium]
MKEHILVCLSPSPSNNKVVLAAYKMAHAFDAELTALYVETPAAQTNHEIKDWLNKSIRAAEKYGAHIASVYGDDIPTQISEYAKAAGITKIVIGRSNHKRRLLFNKPTLTEHLILLVPELEVYIIPDALPPYTDQNEKLVQKKPFSWRSAIMVAALLIIATLIGLTLKKLGFTDANIITVYILSVLFAAYLTDGTGYGVASSVLSVIVFNYLFTEPRFTLQAYGTGYPLTFIIMFIAAILTSSITAKAKQQAKSSAQKAYRTEVLLTASRNLQQAQSIDEILAETAKQLNKLLDRVVLIYPASHEQLGTPLLFGADGVSADKLEDLSAQKEMDAAMWVLKNNRHAGKTTKTYPDACCLYFAVRGHTTVHAVAGIMMETDDTLEAFDKSLLLALLGECGLALEKQKLDEAKNALMLTAQQEQLRANLLRSISHDLRTPLTSISGNADMLLNADISLGNKQKRALYLDIYDDSIWLINLVENLLSITRMDDSSLKLHMKPEMVFDVMEEAVSHLGRKGTAYHITIEQGEELLMARMDAPLIIQVLVNLIDNAIKYTPAGSNIVLSGKCEGDNVLISVADDGGGVSDESKDSIFDMFSTGNSHRGDGRRGLGLGLALCRSIVRAHGGDIWVYNNVPHGAVFTFSLIREEVSIDE